MMPSRGLRALTGGLPRLAQVQTRTYSITRTAPLRSTLRSSHNPSQPLRVTSILTTTQAVRYASTESAPLTTTPTTPRNLPNIDTITLDEIDFGSAGISTTEKIGYLKEIGLDYGWGPSAMVEWTLEHMHIWVGLPWWGSIVATAVFFRCVTLPLFIRASDQTARIHAMQSVIKPISESMNAARKAGDTHKFQEELLRLTAVRKSAGIKFRQTFYPAVAQGVIGYCGFKVIRAMTLLPVPGLVNGGAFWFTDLTISDGYLILPTMIAGTMLLIFRLGGENGVQAVRTTGPTKYMFLYALPSVIFLVTAWQSSALALWFTSGAIFSGFQTLILGQPAVRHALGISPKIKVKPGDAPNDPLAGWLEGFKPAAQSSSPGSTRPKQFQSSGPTRKPSSIIDTTLATKKKQSKTRTFSTMAKPFRRTQQSIHPVNKSISQRARSESPILSRLQGRSQ